MPIVSMKTRRKNSSSLAGGDGGRFSRSSCLSTSSSMKFRRGASANSFASTGFADTAPDRRHGVLAQVPAADIAFAFAHHGQRPV